MPPPSGPTRWLDGSPAGRRRTASTWVGASGRRTVRVGAPPRPVVGRTAHASRARPRLRRLQLPPSPHPSDPAGTRVPERHGRGVRSPREGRRAGPRDEARGRPWTRPPPPWSTSRSRTPPWPTAQVPPASESGQGDARRARRRRSTEGCTRRPRNPTGPRNRVAYHEPLLAEPIADRYQDLLTVVAAVEPRLRAWVDDHNDVLAVMSRRP